MRSLYIVDEKIVSFPAYLESIENWVLTNNELILPNLTITHDRPISWVKSKKDVIQLLWSIFDTGKQSTGNGAIYSSNINLNKNSCIFYVKSPDEKIIKTTYEVGKTSLVVLNVSFSNNNVCFGDDKETPYQTNHKIIKKIKCGAKFVKLNK